jgi:hypothetical protein
VVIALSGAVALAACSSSPAASGTPSAAAAVATSPDSPAPTPLETSPSVTPASPAPAAGAPSASSSPPTRAIPGIAAGLVQASGLQPVTVRPARPGIYAIGDSVMLGSQPVLARHGYHVDAVVSRQASAGLQRLKQVRTAGKLPRNVVLGLGTNGTFTAAQCDAMVTAVGAGRRVFLVTPLAPRHWIAADDAVVRACAARHREQVVLVDWARMAADHRAWFGPDGVHPNSAGRRQYTALLVAATSHFHG